MTAPTWPTVAVCRCGRLQQEHNRLRATTRLPERWGGTDDAACPQFEQVRVEERPPASELHRRLAAVVALPPPVPPAGLTPAVRAAWVAGYDAALTAATLAACGET